jgi:hypothetical protein
MILKEVYECAFKYYKFHKEITKAQRIDNIKKLFGISRASFFRNLKNNNNDEKPITKNRKKKYNEKILKYIKMYVCKNKLININHLFSLIKDKFKICPAVYHHEVMINPADRKPQYHEVILSFPDPSRSYFYVLLNKLNLTNKKVYIKNQPLPKKNIKKF